mmetsp:Transcript_23868/g.66347  ORF Transcript_23868/g.66347 Transcript_23868/m.66347 type:complete len:84 (-) Transcript_23868:149-400(-)
MQAMPKSGKQPLPKSWGSRLWARQEVVDAAVEEADLKAEDSAPDHGHHKKHDVFHVRSSLKWPEMKCHYATPAPQQKAAGCIL